MNGKSVISSLAVAVACAFGAVTVDSHAALSGRDYDATTLAAATFAQQAEDVRAEMEQGGRYSTISSADRTVVERDLDRIAKLLIKHGAVAGLNDQELMALMTAQEEVNALLTGNDGDRYICEYETTTGTHQYMKVCLTVAQRSHIQQETNHRVQEIYIKGRQQ